MQFGFEFDLEVESLSIAAAMVVDQSCCSGAAFEVLIKV